MGKYNIFKERIIKINHQHSQFLNRCYFHCLVFLRKTHLNVSLGSKIQSMYCTSLKTYIRNIYGASKTKRILLYSESRFRKVVHIYTYIRIIQMMGNIQTIFFTMAQQPLAGQRILSFEASRSHSDAPESVGFLWTNDQPDAETSS